MKIFITIASYRDPLLLTTINSAYDNAHNKQNLIFGICEQQEIENCLNVNSLKFKSQIRYIRIDPIYARGACWPRHVAQTLWQDEKYYLQIDSHTIFDPGWDQILIDRYTELKKYHDKPLLSAYIPDFKIEKNGDNETFTKIKVPGCYATVVSGNDPFTNNSNMYLSGKTVYLEKEISHGYMVSGGFIFTQGKVIQEVPYDPIVYFCGEENSLALRLWTNGYNIFHVKDLPLYHKYNTNYDRLTVWGDKIIEDARPIKWSEYDAVSRKRLVSILKGDDLGIYGVGKVRTLEQYVKFTGIDYFTATLEEKAKTGETVFALDYKDSIDI